MTTFLKALDLNSELLSRFKDYFLWLLIWRVNRLKVCNLSRIKINHYDGYWTLSEHVEKAFFTLRPILFKFKATTKKLLPNPNSVTNHCINLNSFFYNPLCQLTFQLYTPKRKHSIEVNIEIQTSFTNTDGNNFIFER